MLKEQFPDILGLQSTLFLEKPPVRYEQDKVHMQIIFDRGNHWIKTSNTFAKKGEILVYDSMYTKIDKNTKTTMTNLFGPSTTAHLAGSSKQTGGMDCGLFAIENVTTLAFKINPTEIMFDQSTLWQHLILYRRRKIYFISYDIIIYTVILLVATCSYAHTLFPTNYNTIIIILLLLHH